MRGRYLILTFVASFAAAGTAGFFAGANYTRVRLPKAPTASADINPAPTSTSTDAIDSAAPTVDAALPESTDTEQQTYIVKKGQTLYSIGKEAGIEWPALAAVNGMTEQSILKEGQVLKIPTTTEAQTVQSREFKVVNNDEEKSNLESAQSYADAGTGQLAYRMVPAQVVQRSPLLSRFAFTTHDLYIEKSKDAEKGEAVVEVTQSGKLYTVYLSAYQKGKGDKSVWTPVRVTY